jgi:hypothetical protein
VDGVRRLVLRTPRAAVALERRSTVRLTLMLRNTTALIASRLNAMRSSPPLKRRNRKWNMAM